MKLNHFLIDGLSAIDDLDYIGMQMFAEGIKYADRNQKANITYYNNRKDKITSAGADIILGPKWNSNHIN